LALLINDMPDGSPVRMGQRCFARTPAEAIARLWLTLQEQSSPRRQT
jgi:hypothetical protein